MRQLLYGQLRDAWRDVGAFAPDIVELERLARRMAVAGGWRPAIERLTRLVAEQTGIRDYLHGEKAVQGSLAAYLSIAGCFSVRTDTELAKGYPDILLLPLAGHHPAPRHGFVVEVKYVGRGAAEKRRVPALAEQAERQVAGYLGDRRLAAHGADVRFRGLALVFRGWELAHASEVDR